jgi:hypothetical protein
MLQGDAILTKMHTRDAQPGYSIPAPALEVYHGKAPKLVIVSSGPSSWVHQGRRVFGPSEANAHPLAPAVGEYHRSRRRKAYRCGSRIVATATLSKL